MLALGIVVTAFAWARLPLGDHALSVSILTVKSTVVAKILFKAIARVVPEIPLPKIGNETLLFAFTSPIFQNVVALA